MIKDIFNKINKSSLLIGILIFLILVLVIYYVSSGESEPVQPMVTLTQEQVNLSQNNKVSLLAYVSNVNDYRINWISSNPIVASVNNYGTVTALSEGTTIITASYLHTDGKTYTDTCIITVIGGIDVKITDITFLGEELVISKNSETKIEPIVLPTDAIINSIKYTSSNPNVAVINDDGILRSLMVGRTTIEIIINDKYSDYLFVNVIDDALVNEYIKVPTAVMFSDTRLELEEGETKNLSYQVSPADASGKYLNWNSSNDSVVSVKDGVITANKEGQVIISVSYNNQVLDNVIVSVLKKEIKVTGVTLTASKTDLKVNETLQLTYGVYPKDATNQSVTFKSSDESIATVSQAGLITGKKTGTATITITTSDGNYSRSLSITISSSSGGSLICDHSSKPNSGGDSSCGVRLQSLYLTRNGSSLSHGSLVKIKVGETITLRVNLPTSCGSPMLLTRTTADGDRSIPWTAYMTSSSNPFVNRYDCSSAVNASSYQWIITGTKVTNGAIEMSQTAEFSTTLYNSIKAMAEIRVQVIE